MQYAYVCRYVAMYVVVFVRSWLFTAHITYCLGAIASSHVELAISDSNERHVVQSMLN